MKLRRRPAPPVDLGAIERELLDKCGGVSAAARALGASSVDLRRLAGSRPLLADAIYEGTERAIDEASKCFSTAWGTPIRPSGSPRRLTFCATPRLGGVAAWGRRTLSRV